MELNTPLWLFLKNKNKDELIWLYSYITKLKYRIIQSKYEVVFYFVIHEDDCLKIVTESKNETIVSINEYIEELYKFIDKIESF